MYTKELYYFVRTTMTHGNDNPDSHEVRRADGLWAGKSIKCIVTTVDADGEMPYFFDVDKLDQRTAGRKMAGVANLFTIMADAGRCSRERLVAPCTTRETLPGVGNVCNLQNPFTSSDPRQQTKLQNYEVSLHRALNSKQGGADKQSKRDALDAKNCVIQGQNAVLRSQLEAIPGFQGELLFAERDSNVHGPKIKQAESNPTSIVIHLSHSDDDFIRCYEFERRTYSAGPTPVWQAFEGNVFDVASGRVQLANLKLVPGANGEPHSYTGEQQALIALPYTI
jgi:hypothetical protein